MSSLKEKFYSISCKDCDIHYCENKCTMLSEYELNKLEQIADDYASEILECYHNNLFFIQLKEGEAKEILKDIKKQKGL